MAGEDRKLDGLEPNEEYDADLAYDDWCIRFKPDKHPEPDEWEQPDSEESCPVDDWVIKC